MSYGSANHEGPEAVGPFANVTYSPADGSGQLIIITMSGSDALETFENQVKMENEASYQVTASNPANGGTS